MVYDAPFVSRHLSERPSIGGSWRERPEDFRVEERPLYEPDGEGQHLYVEATKVSLPTSALVRRLQAALDLKHHHVGTAGRKDSFAVTTQRISLNHATASRVEEVSIDDVEMTVLGRHRNKLQPGHLAGNQFEVRFRPDNPERALPLLNENVQRLRARGVPNFFGPQRFGRRKDTSMLGRLMVHDRLPEFFDQYLGKPGPTDSDRIRAARRAYDKGNLNQARQRWPKHEQNRRKALAILRDRGRETVGPAMGAIAKSRRTLFVNAFQSELFNRLLSERIGDFARLRTGDIARREDSGGMFVVEDLPREARRNQRFDISPTGILPGYDPWPAEEDPGRRERNLMRRHGAEPEDFSPVKYLRCEGSRRPLRVPLKTPRISRDRDRHGPLLRLEFELPPGSYASVVMHELTGQLSG